MVSFPGIAVKRSCRFEAFSEAKKAQYRSVLMARRRDVRGQPRCRWLSSTLGNSGLAKNRERAIQAGSSGLLRCHVFRSTENLHAERTVVANALERLQEAGQVNDTFPR